MTPCSGSGDDGGMTGLIGRLLVAAHIMPLTVREGATLRIVPANLALFRVGEDGRLDFVHKYDVDVGDRTMFWMGMVAL